VTADLRRVEESNRPDALSRRQDFSSSDPCDDSNVAIFPPRLPMMSALQTLIADSALSGELAKWACRKQKSNRFLS
jgi:hypothetical protein